MNEILVKTPKLLHFVNNLKFLKQELLIHINSFYLVYPTKIQTIQLTSLSNNYNLIQYQKLKNESKIIIIYEHVTLFTNYINELSEKEDERNIKKMIIMIIHSYEVMTMLFHYLEQHHIYMFNLQLENLIIDSNGQIKLMLKPNIIIIKDDDINLWSILPFLEENDQLPLELELLRHTNMSIFDIEHIINKHKISLTTLHTSTQDNRIEMKDIITEDKMKLFMSMINQDINNKEYVNTIKHQIKGGWQTYALNKLFYSWLFENKEMEHMLKHKMNSIHMDDIIIQNFKEQITMNI